MPLRDELTSFCRLHQEFTKDIQPLISALDSGDSLTGRNRWAGHITASGLVVQAGRVLQIFHPYLAMWLYPGGHIDPGESPQQAAQREVLEETGLHCELHSWHQTHAMPFDIDIHGIPANAKRLEPAHLHFDFRYLLQAEPPRDAAERQGEAELRCRWMPTAALPDNPCVRRLKRVFGPRAEAFSMGSE